ncbi:MAG: hypothetical protein RIC55_32560 [Pirellulaceae bacterium]
MSGMLATALLLVAALPAQAASPPTDEEIRQAVEQLASPVFAERQEASSFLWRAGQEAEPALRKALTYRDPEVVYRARLILDQFRYGIYPDTPADIVGIIEDYRDGDTNGKRAALKQLRDRGDILRLLKLLKLEPNETLRQQFNGEFARDYETTIPELLVKGKLDDAEAWLDLSADTSDNAMRHLATLLLLTGRLEQRTEALRKEVKGSASDFARQRLFYYLRAAGKVDEALRVVDELDEPSDRISDLRQRFLFERRDWPRLVALDDEALKQNAGLAGNVDFLVHAATHHRLAGDSKAFEEDVKSFVQMAAADDEAALQCAEALLVNGRFQEGIEAFSRHNPEMGFRLLMAQLRYREAFALVGLPELGQDPLPWFQQVARDAQSNDKDLRARLSLGQEAAQALLRLGRREQALAAYALLGDALAGDENGQRLRTHCAKELKRGLREMAFDHGALALQKGPDGAALPALFPEQSDEARVWWDFFRQWHPTESHRAALERVAAVLRSKTEDAAAEEAIRILLDQAIRAAASLDKDRRNQWHLALAETSLRRGERPRALELLENVAESSPSAALRLADLLLEDEKWLSAARWYQEASADVEHRALAMYMNGYCLDQHGRNAEGAQLMETAALLPMATGPKRRDLAEGLKDRGLIDAANEQWRLIRRTTAMGDWYSSNAAMNLGNTVSAEDPLAAADYWEILSLSVLNSGSAFIDVTGYLQLPHLIHKARARGLLAEGKHRQAVDNLWISQAAYPSNIDLAEDLIPELEAADLRTAADELFAKVYAPNRRLCDDFPDNASAHNNLAWLAARSGRRLEEAVHHARRAVELAPDTAAYLDTLAEALFRTGGRDEAIKLARRCLEQEPENEHYQKQLARFEAE